MTEFFLRHEAMISVLVLVFPFVLLFLFTHIRRLPAHWWGYMTAGAFVALGVFQRSIGNDFAWRTFAFCLGLIASSGMVTILTSHWKQRQAQAHTKEETHDAGKQVQ